MNKEEKYTYAINSIEAYWDKDNNLISNAANIAGVLKEVFNWWWVGFYFVENNVLQLGPYQGPPTCTTQIAFDKGVCGKTWQKQETIIVPDVHKFDGHIACSSASNSEIVIPVFKNEKVFAVLDIDSDKFNDFDSIDKKYLESIVKMFESRILTK